MIHRIHNDDCDEQLDSFGYCQRCAITPDMQSVAIVDPDKFASPHDVRTERDSLRSALAAAQEQTAAALRGQEMLKAGHCTGTVRDGFVSCGEGGNYCSTSCQYKAERDALVPLLNEALDREQKANEPVDKLLTANEAMTRIVRDAVRERDTAISQRDAALARAKELEDMLRVSDEQHAVSDSTVALNVERDTAEAIAAWLLGGEAANGFGVDLTDPSCPIGSTLTAAADAIRANAWRKGEQR